MVNPYADRRAYKEALSVARSLSLLDHRHTFYVVHGEDSEYDVVREPTGPALATFSAGLRVSEAEKENT